jgi:hypothetical protein
MYHEDFNVGLITTVCVCPDRNGITSDVTPLMSERIYHHKQSQGDTGRYVPSGIRTLILVRAGPKALLALMQIELILILFQRRCFIFKGYVESNELRWSLSIDKMQSWPIWIYYPINRVVILRNTVKGETRTRYRWNNLDRAPTRQGHVTSDACYRFVIGRSRFKSRPGEVWTRGRPVRLSYHRFLFDSSCNSVIRYPMTACFIILSFANHPIFHSKHCSWWNVFKRIINPSHYVVLLVISPSRRS